jgi:hypothetical protein
MKVWRNQKISSSHKKKSGYHILTYYSRVKYLEMILGPIQKINFFGLDPLPYGFPQYMSQIMQAGNGAVARGHGMGWL